MAGMQIRRRALADIEPAAFSDTVAPLLQRIYRGRNLAGDQDIALDLKELLPPTSLLGLPAAVSLLLQCLQQGQRILIVGDFDADGATSSALAIRALKAFGHSDVQFLVPNRFDYGYGLTPAIVEIAARQQPALIITVDNGISSIDGVARAQELGIQVLVTDHHLPGEQLPSADAIVNPNQHGCEFPSKALAGVGVIFYLMAALRAELLASGWFESRGLTAPKMADYLDLVALGTVADVVPLDQNNRIMVEQGLRRIRSGRGCAGIRALAKVAGKSAASLTSSDIGFALGPRLNAAGRLDDISIGIAMLLTDDDALASEIAEELDSLNRDRRQIEAAMQVESERHIAALGEAEESGELPTGIALYDENWHQGVVGILSSRIKEQHHRPVICFAPASDDPADTTLKGSARSINGFHIRDALDRVATRNPGLIEKFGGHAMAAGLSIQREAFATFATQFDTVAKEWLSEPDLQAVLYTDGELAGEEVSLANAQLLKLAQPWGQKMPEPLFDGQYRIHSQRLVGGNHLKLQLAAPGSTQRIDAIAFNIDLAQWPNEKVKEVRIAYSLDVNDYRGLQSVQFIVRHIEALE